MSRPGECLESRRASELSQYFLRPELAIRCPVYKARRELGGFSLKNCRLPDSCHNNIMCGLDFAVHVVEGRVSQLAASRRAEDAAGPDLQRILRLQTVDVRPAWDQGAATKSPKIRNHPKSIPSIPVQWARLYAKANGPWRAPLYRQMGSSMPGPQQLPACDPSRASCFKVGLPQPALLSQALELSFSKHSPHQCTE